MAKDYNLTSRRFELMDPWPSGAGRAGDQNSSWWSSVAEATTSEGSNWTTSSKYATLDSCGPSEYIFIFYAYYYGLMFLVSIIGVVGNTAVIRPVDLLYTMSRKKQLERFRSVRSSTLFGYLKQSITRSQEQCYFSCDISVSAVVIVVSFQNFQLRFQLQLILSLTRLLQL